MLREAATETDTIVLGAGGSRLVTGSRPVHQRLREDLAHWLGREPAALPQRLPGQPGRCGGPGRPPAALQLQPQRLARAEATTCDSTGDYNVSTVV